MGQIGFGMDQEVLSKVKDYLKLAGSDIVVLSPTFFRDYSCFENCGACCNHSNISLEYIEDSDRWRLFKTNHSEKSKLFYQTIDETSGVQVMRYRQESAPVKTRCHFLNDNGRCSIHDSYPFPCNFAFSKFKDFSSKNLSRLTTEQYGRAWNFTRLDGQKGAMCGMLSFSYTKLEKDINNLKELYEYAIQLNIKTKLPYIILHLEELLPTLKQFDGQNPYTFFKNVEFRQENI